MVRPLWQMLLEDPANLTCDECFAVMEYYAEGLARGGADLLPEVTEHLKRCPHCELQHREALRRLLRQVTFHLQDKEPVCLPSLVPFGHRLTTTDELLLIIGLGLPVLIAGALLFHYRE